MQIIYYPEQEQRCAGRAFQGLDIKATRSKLGVSWRYMVLQWCCLLAAALTSIHRIGEPALAGFAVMIFNLMDKGMRI